MQPADLRAIKQWNSEIKDRLDIVTETEGDNWSSESEIEPEVPLSGKNLDKEWFISRCHEIADQLLMDHYRLCIDLLNLLRSKDVDIQSQLVDLIGYESFDFLETLINDRKTIVDNITIHFNHLHPPDLKNEMQQSPFGTQVTVISKKEQDMMKKARKLQRKQKNNIARDEVESSVLLGFKVLDDEIIPNDYEFNEKISLQKDETYPNVYKTQNSRAISSYSNKFTLPEGTIRTDDMDKEEIFIPVPKVAPIAKSERLIPITDFEKWIQPTFQGYKSLNRMQSIVYPIAFETNENMLICAPTGAGKTDVALLTILRTISNFRSNSKIETNDFKIVYVAPMKALAAEIVRKFSKRLQYLKIQVRELTGDMQLTKAEIQSTVILLISK